MYVRFKKMRIAKSLICDSAKKEKIGFLATHFFNYFFTPEAANSYSRVTA